MIPPRIEVVSSVSEVDAELERIGCDRPGRAIMAPKGVLRVVRVTGLDARAAGILKQEFLAKGGECALPRGVYDLPPKSTTDALLMGTERCFDEILWTLRMQPYGLKALGVALEEGLRRTAEPRGVWRCGRFALPVGETTHVMAILNLTPDSFSGDDELFGADGPDVDLAVATAQRMVADGAHVLDVGGESTRPGSSAVDEAEELARVIPVIEALVHDAVTSPVPVSVDTRKPGVARAALAAGASIVNDVGGFRDPAVVDAVAASDCGVAVMHMQGEPGTMQAEPHYEDLVGEIYRWLAERTDALAQAGVDRERIAVDVGIGFGKTSEHNLELIRRLGEFRCLGFPIVIGTSRKRFIGAVLGIDDPKDRLEGTAATVTAAVLSGAQVVRVHDVKKMARVARMADAMRTGSVKL